MKKKIIKIVKIIMLGIVAIVGVITLGGAVFLNVSPQFGGKSSELSLERFQKSPNFFKGTFKSVATSKK